MSKIFHDVELIEDPEFTYKDILDPNSAHVGVHFIGNATKPGSPAYQLTETYRVHVDVDRRAEAKESGISVIPARDNSFLADANLCYEFSINWARAAEKGGLIPRTVRTPRPAYASRVDAYQGAKKAALDEFQSADQIHNALSLLNVHDPDADLIRRLLDILHPDRYQDYSLWFRVLCALANTSPDYQPLAEYFSKKSNKYDEAEFRDKWTEALAAGNLWRVGSIHYWAKEDNPERYAEVNKRNVARVLYEKIYSMENEGCLEHFDIADILHRMLKNKFTYDTAEGSLKGAWYEFILEEDPKRQGEVFKWRRYSQNYPPSMSNYISVIMPELFRRALTKIKEKYESSSDGLAKYHAQIFKNFQRTSRSLKNSGFKSGVMMEAKNLFNSIGFADMLDKDPLATGVGNGVLKMGRRVELMTGFHGYPVSKFTPVNFVRMNPYNPTTKKLLIALHNLFPDDEPDSFNFIMHYNASTLDGKIKDSIMLLLVGKGSNGKTFLVELHKATIGAAYGVKMPMEFLTSQSKGADAATPSLMQLMYAHFAYYSESAKQAPLNEPRIKEVLGQETLAGRKLFGDMLNFKPHCQHMATSNHDFRIDGTDHGIWRRIKYLCMKIKFVNMATEKINPSSPYERPGDPSVGKKWADDPEVHSAYLGILVWYYESLERNYGGNLMKVPHPTIQRESNEFRNRQDRMNEFFTRYLVKCEDPAARYSLVDVRTKYTLWHNSEHPGDTSFVLGLMDALENSCIGGFLMTTRRGKYLVGYRVLDLGESKADEETYYLNPRELQEMKSRSETSEEYYARICREFDSNKYEIQDAAWVPQVEHEDEDSDFEEEIKELQNAKPSILNSRTAHRDANLLDPVDEADLLARRAMVESLNRKVLVSDSESSAADGPDSESEDSD